MITQNLNYNSGINDFEGNLETITSTCDLRVCRCHRRSPAYNIHFCTYDRIYKISYVNPVDELNLWITTIINFPLTVFFIPNFSMNICSSNRVDVP